MNVQDFIEAFSPASQFLIGICFNHSLINLDCFYLERFHMPIFHKKMKRGG